MRAPHRSQHHRGGTRKSRAAHRLILLLLSGLPSVAAPISPAQAQTAPPVPAEASTQLAGFVSEASQRFGIPVAWIRALMRVESANDARAVSPKGAIGLMQIMPDTWAYLRAHYRLGSDPFDPRDNIIAGTAYMRELYDRYGAPGFLAAYNAGPARYDDYLAIGRPLPAETRAYVAQLTPLVGGEASPAIVTIAAADPLAWTRAPLFIGASDRGPGAGPAQADARARDGDTAATPRDAAADANTTGGLFVSRREPAGPR
ncbi:MAG: lytic transglycosylase domain-containing protein [Xanthobacteraceae bacterium]